MTRHCWYITLYGDFFPRSGGGTWFLVYKSLDCLGLYVWWLKLKGIGWVGERSFESQSIVFISEREGHFEQWGSYYPDFLLSVHLVCCTPVTWRLTIMYMTLLLFDCKPKTIWTCQQSFSWSLSYLLAADVSLVNKKSSNGFRASSVQVTGQADEVMLERWVGPFWGPFSYRILW